MSGGLSGADKSALDTLKLLQTEGLLQKHRFFLLGPCAFFFTKPAGTLCLLIRASYHDLSQPLAHLKFLLLTFSTRAGGSFHPALSLLIMNNRLLR
jgi:hypothetical protein